MSDSWCGKIPHAVGQLSQWATTTEACVPRDDASKQGKPLQWEAHELKLQRSLHLPQLEKACAQQ